MDQSEKRSTKQIRILIREALEFWYHGSPDARDLQAQAGFSSKFKSIDYISDVSAWKENQEGMKVARANNDEDEYWRLLDLAGTYRKQYKMKSPVFLTNKKDVAQTYTDPHRASDYQNAEPGILKTSVNPGKNVKIVATGDRFRFIDVEKVKAGFVRAGISEDEFQNAHDKFNYYTKPGTGIKTDCIAAIGQWLGFDSIDVMGVLDSYHGGTTQSTVRMVFDPKNIKVIR